MTSQPIISRLPLFRKPGRFSLRVQTPLERVARPSLGQLAQNPSTAPRFVQESAVAMRYLHLLAPLPWEDFPERDLDISFGLPPVPYVPFVAACLVKLDRQFAYMSQLRQFLIEHPALVWILGFPLVSSSKHSEL